MNSVVETDNLKAKIKVMDKKKDFQLNILRPSRCNYKTIRTRNISFRTRVFRVTTWIKLGKTKIARQ
jgi:hypothetical protein